MQNPDDSSLHRSKNDDLPKQSVLLIDDSRDTLLIHKMILELDGFKVFTAQSGVEAFAVLARIDKPNLILLDMKMEDMTGTEFLTELETQRPEIINEVPVVFLTGMNDVPKSRASGFIRKPADLNEFLKSVHRFIEMGSQARQSISDIEK